MDAHKIHEAGEVRVVQGLGDVWPAHVVDDDGAGQASQEGL